MGTSKRMPRSSTTGRQGSARPRIVIVTGLSGSGKTVALRALEDADYFCVDNLPFSLIGALVESLSGNTGVSKIAVGIDIREISFLSGIRQAISRLRKNYDIDVLFLEARTDTLVRRFKETRRPHPLRSPLETAIRTERKAVSPLRDAASRVIDTSSLTPHQLRSLITTLYSGKKRKQDIALSLISFGFKYGIPQNIDLLFDVRFLSNPFFMPSLKDLNGTDSRVARYVIGQEDTGRFLKKVHGLLNFLIPRYIHEGKTYLSIAFGCTGGKHRSPAVVEHTAAFLRKKNYDLNIIHRDMT